MINDEAQKCCYFAVKNVLELYSLRWLRNKKETIINGNNCLQTSLNDALNYQNIERDLQRIPNIKSYTSKCNWKGQNFQLGQNTEKNLNKIIRQLILTLF